MKKLAILVVLLLVTVSAFAQTSPGRFATSPGAGTTLNDDSCDIGVTPAATLLIPYFEVGLQDNSAEAVNTIFSITNTSPNPQIAHVTIWSDWSWPVIDFNIYLTGYDVQSVNLHDVIVRGEVPVTDIDSSDPGVRGSLSSGTNPAFLGSVETDCQPSQGGTIPADLAAAVRSALTGGPYSFTSAAIATCSQVGSASDNAQGYITIDVARTCSTTLPTDDNYYSNEIAFDNVLTGDYFNVAPDASTGNLAGGDPMVHIRAIPEGTVDSLGADCAFTSADVTFPHTFYDRYTDPLDPKEDRRQPLPGLWAARYIEGVLDAETDYQIWREGVTRGEPVCATIGSNATISLTEIVKFDESENPSILPADSCTFSPCPGARSFTLPETGSFNVSDTTRFPADTFTDAGGWTFLNLNQSDATTCLRPGYNCTSSNWVSVSIQADGRFSVDYSATWLANGCTMNPGESTANASGSAYDIGPVDNNPFDCTP